MNERRSDSAEFGAPTCPDCGIVLRDERGALLCPECGWAIPAPNVTMPPDFDGPDFHQF